MTDTTSYDHTMAREILVRGEGEIRALPDFARVRASVDGEGVSRDEAYDIAAGAASALDAVFEEHGTAFARVITTALMVQPRTRWRKGETVRTGWQASRTSVVEITDLSRVGDLLALMTRAGAAISGVSWQLDPHNDAFAEARRRAGEDARGRADQYAEALGVTLGEVAWVAEPGLLTSDASSMHYAVASAAGGLAEDAVIDVAPEEITVRAAIEVGFTIGA